MAVARIEHPWSRALVTGASSGIGRALAERLAAADVGLVLVARRAAVLEALAEQLRPGSAASVEVLAADLSDPVGRATVAERLAADGRDGGPGAIDLLVNNAGLGAAGPFVDGDPTRDAEMVAVNIAAVVELSRAALGPMRDRRRGWVCNISSLGGHTPGPRFAVYSATKAFVTSFSESLHEELRGDGVVVTAICPGATHTDFGATSGAVDDQLPAFLWQRADEVADEALAATAAGRAVRVTGWPNRLAGSLSTVLPRAANRKMAGAVAARL
jgi:uncharacterized protein